MRLAFPPSQQLLASVANVASLSPQQRVLLTQALSPRQTYSFAPFNLKCLSGSPAGSRGHASLVQSPAAEYVLYEQGAIVHE